MYEAQLDENMYNWNTICRKIIYDNSIIRAWLVSKYCHMMDVMHQDIQDECYDLDDYYAKYDRNGQPMLIMFKDMQLYIQINDY